MSSSDSSSTGVADVASDAVPLRASRSWRPFALVAVVFTSGVVVGAAVTHLTSNRFPGPPGPPGQMAERMLADLKDRLDLTEAQAAQVKAILDEREARMEQIRSEMHPRIENELRSLESQIGDVLDPEQRTKWEARVEEMRRRMPPGGRGPHGGRPGPPGP